MVRRRRRLGSRKTLYTTAGCAVLVLLAGKVALNVYEGSWCWKVSGVPSHTRVSASGRAATALTPLSALLHRRGVTPPHKVKLKVDKSERLMELIIDESVVKTYIIALGTNPDLKRTRRGDCATPEGDYYVCEKNPRSQYYLSLKLSYPSIEDGRRGLRDGLIDRPTYTRIERAIRRRRTPPMDTRLGGDICIHGGGAGYLDRRASPPVIEVTDWTEGCIALGKGDIKELFDLVPVGTPVHIDP